MATITSPINAKVDTRSTLNKQEAVSKLGYLKLVYQRTYNCLTLCRIDKLDEWSMTKNVILPLAFFYGGIPFVIIALIANLLLIRIVHKKREMHTTTNYLLVSMAVSDVITVLLWPLYYFSSQSSFASFLRLRKSASWFPSIPLLCWRWKGTTRFWSHSKQDCG